MGKRTYFDAELNRGWPKPEEIEHYFLAPPDERWFFDTGTDGGFFQNEGAYGTDRLETEGDRIDVRLIMWADPDLGVLLIWSKWGGGHREVFSSKGDLTRLREFVRTLHGDPMPVGLYIPFDKAWLAVKEFLETDGELPKSIEWVANDDLPRNTFPDPGTVEISRRGSRG
jgi:immunity protein Imm1 of predicted polymorphic toxin system